MMSALLIREILFPTDFSPSSEVAGRAAADLARHFGARLHVLHVVPPVTDPTPAPDAFRVVVSELGRDVAVLSEVSSGLPARQIAAYAPRAGIDVIVMGRHGRSGVSHALIGSVAEAVVRRAPCWVLTVPGPLAPREVAVEERAQAEAACLVCGKPSPHLICEPCRARVRGEALERKIRDERAGRTA